MCGPWIGAYHGRIVSIMAVNRSKAGMRQPFVARVRSKLTRPNLPAGQFVAFDASSRATIMRYWELFGPGASVAAMEAGVSFDSGTPRPRCLSRVALDLPAEKRRDPHP